MTSSNSQPKHGAYHSDSVIRADSRLGPALKQLRLKYNLSIDYLSEQIKISPRLIEGIEENDYSAFRGSIYAIGCIKAYAEYFHVDPVPLIAEFKGNFHLPETNLAMPRDRAEGLTPFTNPALWIRVFSFAIIIMIGAVVYLYWQQQTSEQQDVQLMDMQQDFTKDNKKERFELDNPDQQAKTLAQALPAEKQVAPEESQLPAVASETDSEMQPNPVASGNNSSETTQQTAGAVDNTKSDEPMADTKIAEQEQEHSIPATENLNPENEVAQPPANIPTKGISINIISSCWLDIRDAKGKALMHGEYRSGTYPLSGTLPIDAVIDNASAVRVYIDGKNIPLSPDPKTNVAHIKLGS